MNHSSVQPTTDYRLPATVMVVTRRGDDGHSFSMGSRLLCCRIENDSIDEPTYVRTERENRAAAEGESLFGSQDAASVEKPKGGDQFPGSLVFCAVECRNRTYTLLPGSACRQALLRGGRRSIAGN